MTAGTEQVRQYGGWTSERRVGTYRPVTHLNRRWTDVHQKNEAEGVERRGRALGWFSIGLGLAEIGAPRALARLIGISDDEEVRNTMFALGLREITSGIGILSRPSPPGGYGAASAAGWPWIWPCWERP